MLLLYSNGKIKEIIFKESTLKEPVRDCANNPVSNIDPNGKDWWDIVKAAATGALQGGIDGILLCVDPPVGAERIAAKLGATAIISDSYKALAKL